MSTNNCSRHDPASAELSISSLFHGMGYFNSQHRLRVCHLGKFYPPAPGGIETHVRALAQAQAAMGMDVTVLCVNHLNRRGIDTSVARYGATPTEIDQDGAVTVIRVGRSASVARFDICTRLPRIIRELNRQPFDVMHLHTPNPTMLLAVAALTGHGTPLIITHHSDIVRQRVLRWALEPFARRMYVRSRAVLASTESYAGASQILARHSDKLDVLPMGLDLKPFLEPDADTLREEMQIRSARPRPLWLAVGRCVYYKGYHTAIAALPHVPGRLLVIGRGPLEQSLRKQAMRLGVDHRITWWGQASDAELRGAYRAATALWFPSNARSEAFGLVQIEAMASGCPVINTDIPNSGVAWVSRHEETGLTIPMNNPAALAAAAQRLMNEPGLRDRLATAARQRAQDEFDHRTMASRSYEVYRRVLREFTTRQAPARIRLRDWVKQQACELAYMRASSGGQSRII